MNPVLTQVLCLCVVTCYLLLGSAVFNYTEYVDPIKLEKQRVAVEYGRIDCIRRVLRAKNWQTLSANAAEGVHDIDNCNIRFDANKLPSNEWNFLSALLFSFTVITTIGYGNIVPSTNAGKAFSIIYGMIGIPLTLLVIANIGQWLSELVEFLFEKRKKYKNQQDDDEPRTTLCSAIVCALAFALYIFLGALIIPLFDAEKDFASTIYFNFITLTTVGLGDMVPAGNGWLLFSLVYIIVGLALTTMAIEIAADYLRKLHWFGRKFTGCANAPVWFGGERLTVRRLTGEFGHKFGIPMEEVDHFDFDSLVTETLATMKISRHSSAFSLIKGGEQKQVLVNVYPEERPLMAVKTGELESSHRLQNLSPLIEETSKEAATTPDPPADAQPAAGGLPFVDEAK